MSDEGGHRGPWTVPGPTLTNEEVQELPEGQPIEVVWSGGNGPARYVITKDDYGRPYAWVKDLDKTGNLRFYNALTFVGTARFHTRVRKVPT